MQKQCMLVRADASATIGIGHVMRCIALAEAWQKAGGRVLFAMAAGGGDLADRIRSHGGSVERIEAQGGSRDDAVHMLGLLNAHHAEWLVIDGYHLLADYRNSLKSPMWKSLWMDDGEWEGAFTCDVVVNSEPGSSEQTYHGAGGQAQFLSGPSYVLLRREFLEYPARRRDPAEKVRRILVTLGGGDADNVSLRVIQALQGVEDGELEISVVIGPSNPHGASLEAAIIESRHKVRLVRNATNMPELMSQSDLAITAGGGTCCELAFMKVPMFLITTAKTQEGAAAAMGAAKAAVVVGRDDLSDLNASTVMLQKIIRDSALRGELAANASRMVDGKGAERIVERMFAMKRCAERAGERG